MWKLWAFEYLQMDCNGSGNIVGLVTSLSLIAQRNQNKRQTNGLFTLIFNETFSLCLKLHICWNTDDVIELMTKNKAVEKFWKLIKYSKWRLNIVHIEIFKCP